MRLSATSASPLRSKRAIASPVSLRAKASGFTRISVLSMRGWAGVYARSGSSALRAPVRRAARSSSRDADPSDADLSELARPRAPEGRSPRSGVRAGRSPRSGARAARRAALGLLAARHLGLAVGAQPPARVERPTARCAWLLELAGAARAAEERLLDLGAALRARGLLDLRQPRLRRGDLQLALAHVVQVLGRPHDRVDDRADEREE